MKRRNFLHARRESASGGKVKSIVHKRGVAEELEPYS